MKAGALCMAALATRDGDDPHSHPVTRPIQADAWAGVVDTVGLDPLGAKRRSAPEHTRDGVHPASAYVVLPGGFGTLHELAEILTLVQSGKTRRIPILLVQRYYWDGLIRWFRATLVREGASTRPIWSSSR